MGHLLARWWLDIATAIHLYEAILATLAIVVWHFYQVFFDPDVYPHELGVVGRQDVVSSTIARSMVWIPKRCWPPLAQKLRRKPRSELDGEVAPPIEQSDPSVDEVVETRK